MLPLTFRIKNTMLATAQCLWCKHALNNMDNVDYLHED